MEIEYRIIRSSRKSLALQVDQNGQVIVRAPYGVSGKYINDFVMSKKEWIISTIEKAAERKEERAAVQKLTEDEIRALADKAVKVIPERVKYYAPKVGVTYGRITIRNQRTRWGSCSGKGNLNFNCLLMLMPMEVIDSVVVHELCHRKEMNHSKNFYAEVYRVYPEYDKWHGWLKKHGREIMDRM